MHCFRLAQFQNGQSNHLEFPATHSLSPLVELFSMHLWFDDLHLFIWLSLILRVPEYMLLLLFIMLYNVSFYVPFNTNF